jgi:hypothetical protein
LPSGLLMSKELLPALLCVVCFAAGFLIMFITQRRRGKGYHTPPRKSLNIFGTRKQGIKRGGGTKLPASNQANPTYTGYPADSPPYVQAPVTDSLLRDPVTPASAQPGISKSTKGGTKCPYCQQPCNPSNAKLCPVCNTAHHKDCWQENGGCTRLSCTGKISRN